MNILVALPLNDSQRARLEAAAPEARFAYPATSADAQEGTGLSMGTGITDEQIADADVIIGNLPCNRLAVARHLQLLQLNSAGYDRYMQPDALPKGAVLASASGAYGQAVSEHMLAMVLALMKHLPAYRDDQKARSWTDHGAVATLADAHVLVLGAGDIGTHFAQLASALGAHVAGVRRHVGNCPQGFESVHAMDELPDLLPQADAVVSFLPSAPATRGLANNEFFSCMKPGALFANGGRGDLVVEDALVEALESGHLAGAALDVTSPEPLPAESPLWDAPNILITPHVSGGFHLPVVLDNIVDIAADNLRRLQAGKPIRNAVNRQ